MQFNALNKEIGKRRKAGEDAADLQAQSKELKAGVAAAEAAAATAEKARDAELGGIGNIVHESVPTSADEADNAVVSTWGQPRSPPTTGGPEGGPLLSHVDLVARLDIVDLEAGVSVAGGRGYFLKREGVLLNQALIQAALAHGVLRGATPIQTPFLMTASAMAGCAQLSQFDEELYKVPGGSTAARGLGGGVTKAEVSGKGGGEDGTAGAAGGATAGTSGGGSGEDKYLIATSEQPLCALHRGRWFEERDLPLSYIGYSTCFRKEAGSHGRDTLGIFRVHQFEKVEQFRVTSPSDNASWEALEDMLATAESFYQALGLPYRVVNIVSGELNAAAAKKYDLEAWFPASATYRELVSASNCTDYQSRALEARLRTPKAPGLEPVKACVHMLNGTLTATERTLCCVLENWQTPEGVTVPPLLRPYMPGGIEFIPWRKKPDGSGRLVPV
jgi:seryl-tRNA synthetase